ncbi:MAG: NapC/NirT family cytochrome c [Bryobacteraceae bacterium]
MKPTAPRPVIALLTSHWISLLGAALVTTAVFSWLFVLPSQMHGKTGNPYIGLLIFIYIPVVFFIGLALMPLGFFLAKKQIAAGLQAAPDRKTTTRRLAIFFGVTTFLNLLIGTQVTYRAVAHMETVQFCGQSCHVMKPEFTAHKNTVHSRVTCTQCHVAPGASGWIASKMAGTRQLMGVVFNNYPRPIASAMESNRLVPASETCEECHWPGRTTPVKVRLISSFKDDEKNTAAQTVLSMMVGGGKLGGIHGAHIGTGIQIRYAASDAKRQTIPWVEYRNSATGKTVAYTAADAKPDTVKGLPTFTMQCVDCHNRPTHAFELPERAVDEAMARGLIPATLPFIKKKSVEVLKMDYSTTEEATAKIPVAVDAYYRNTYAEVYAKRSSDIARAGKAISDIYNRNVFPDLKVTWGTYPNNLGHTDFPGCFRCHDQAHSAPDGASITQDCTVCHQAVAVEEAAPEVLKTLGVAERITQLN